MPPSVLFVCTANICRSPMAVVLFRLRLQQARSDWREWRVESAGTWAVNGQQSPLEAQQTMARRGVDISGHRSREVSADLLSHFQLILTMEAGQKEALRFEFPQMAERVFMLSEMSGVQVAVRDPMGESASVYEAAADQIDRLLERGMERLVFLASGGTERRASAETPAHDGE